MTFNGTAAMPTSWSATGIVVNVPAGATSGNVVVTVGGVASNGVTFTVSNAYYIQSACESESGQILVIDIQQPVGSARRCRQSL